MKFSRPCSRPASGSGKFPVSRAVSGFTFPEMLVAMAILMLVVTGILSAHIFGLRMFQANQTKLTATQWSRETFGRLTDEIHACNAVSVGSISNGVFVPLLDGEVNQGNAILINLTGNATNYIVYYLNPSDQTFRRVTDQANSAVILADSVTNTMIFSARDFSGNILVNNANNRVIHLALDFYQPQTFMEQPNYYQLETSVTRRALQ